VEELKIFTRFTVTAKHLLLLDQKPLLPHSLPANPLELAQYTLPSPWRVSHHCQRYQALNAMGTRRLRFISNISGVVAILVGKPGLDSSLLTDKLLSTRLLSNTNNVN
jgi:hypothetical protein